MINSSPIFLKVIILTALVTLALAAEEYPAYPKAHPEAYPHPAAYPKEYEYVSFRPMSY